MKSNNKGGITLFTILSLVLVMSCLLTLLEGARVYELHRMAFIRSQGALESAFAKYNTCLWENYHLLGNSIDGAKNIIENSAKAGGNTAVLGTNLLRLNPQSVEIEEYTLLTDGEGKAYINAVSGYMKKNILYETAKAIFNQYEAIKNLVEKNAPGGTEISDALDSLKELEKETRGGTDENPLEYIERIQKTQLLELVIEDTKVLSTLEYDLSESVSQRELKTGKNSSYEEIQWLDQVFLQQYFMTYLSDFIHPAKDRGLSYELEYLLGGKNNDIENLREVVNQLFLIREAANIAYLFSDVEKMELAHSLALALAGATANVAVIKVVQLGIIVAWAFGESVLDIRALLQGKKIPLIKNRESWTLGLENLDQFSESYMCAQEVDNGISYKTYLGVLLLFQKENVLAQRGMDIQEVTLQKSPGAVLLDRLMVKGRVKIVYEYKPVFYDITEKLGNFCEIIIVADYGYY